MGYDYYTCWMCLEPACEDCLHLPGKEYFENYYSSTFEKLKSKLTKAKWNKFYKDYRNTNMKEYCFRDLCNVCSCKVLEELLDNPEVVKEFKDTLDINVDNYFVLKRPTANYTYNDTYKYEPEKEN